MSGPADADGRIWDSLYDDLRPAPSQDDVVAYLTWTMGANMRAQYIQEAVEATERARAAHPDPSTYDYSAYPVAQHMQRIGLPLSRDAYIARRWGAGYRPSLREEPQIPPPLRQWPPCDPD